MLSVAYAFVIATALFLAFKQTRWMGIIGIFVLLAISPLIVSCILLAAGAAAWLLFRRDTGWSESKLLAGPAQGRSRKAFLPVLALMVGVALAIGYSEPTSEDPVSTIVNAVRSAPRNEVIVLRTPGGLLEVARIEATEMLDATIEHEVLGIKIGKTMPRIRVPAVYRYHIPLESEWRVVRADGVFTVVAPRIRPSLPVAVNFEQIQRDVAGSWVMLWTGDDDLELLERSVTQRLEDKAKSKDYLDRQREDARETVREFARKWITAQTRWKHAGYSEIRVLFEDEPAGAIAPL